MKNSVWIIRDSGHDMNVVAQLCPMKSYIIPTEYLWIEVLANE